MTAKVFKNGNSRAIRIPKGILPEDIDEVIIEKMGDGLIIKPKRNNIDLLFELIENNKNITDGFLDERNQPPVQNRDLF